MPMTTRDGCLQRLDVRQVLGRAGAVRGRRTGRPREVLLRRLRRSVGRGAVAGCRHVESGVDHELVPGRLKPVGVEGLDDGLGVGPMLGGVGQQLQQRRLVGDERADPPGMAGDQRQPGHRPAAGAEHVGRVGAEVVEDGGDVVGARLGRRLLVGSSIVLLAYPRGS